MVFYCVIIPLVTYNSCVVDHVSGGILFPTWIIKQGISYSSFFSRYLSIGKSCPIGAPCHAYITVPEDPSHFAIFNMHINPDMDNIVIRYDSKLKF